MKTLDPLAGLSAFIALADALNFSTAAGRLGVSRATMSTQVSELEKRLGVRLFHRTTRSVRLTEAGEAYRSALGGVVGQASHAAEIAQSYQSEAIGRIRITAPDELVERFILPVVPAFLADQPGLSIEIDLSSQRVDVVKDGFDLAVRASLAVEPNLIVRKLGASPVTLTASPGYLKRRGVPKSPDDLKDHDIVQHSGLKAGMLWTLKRGSDERRVPVAPLFSSNSGAALRDVAVEGVGITYLPEFITGEALRSGALVRVLEDWKVRSVDVNAVYPSNRNITPKVRRFVGLLAKQFESHPDFA